MFLLLLSYIFCNQCPLYFENNLKKVRHDCKINKFNCFYSILTPKIKVDIEKLHLKFIEYHKNAGDNIEELNKFIIEISGDIDNWKYLKNNADKYYKESFVNISKKNKVSLQLESIVILINKCYQEFKCYKNLLKNDSMISLFDQIDKIENKKKDFFITHRKLFLKTYNDNRKLKFPRFNNNRCSEEYIRLKHKIQKSKNHIRYYKELCDDKDQIFKNIKQNVSELNILVQNKFCFDNKNSFHESVNHSISFKLSDFIASKLNQLIKKLKDRKHSFHKGKMTESDVHKSINQIHTCSSESKSSKFVSIIHDIEELENKIYTKTRIVLHIFEELIELYNFINSIEKMKRYFEFEYYLHEISKLKEFKKCLLVQ